MVVSHPVTQALALQGTSVLMRLRGPPALPQPRLTHLALASQSPAQTSPAQAIMINAEYNWSKHVLVSINAY